MYVCMYECVYKFYENVCMLFSWISRPKCKRLQSLISLSPTTGLSKVYTCMYVRVCMFVCMCGASMSHSVLRCCCRQHDLHEEQLVAGGDIRSLRQQRDTYIPSTRSYVRCLLCSSSSERPDRPPCAG